MLLLILAALPAALQTLPPGQIARIERAATEAMSKSSIPGLTAAVATGGELRWSNGYGFADLENFVPAKASTVHRLGSISKPIAAVAAMQLVEQGKLDLDAPRGPPLCGCGSTSMSRAPSGGFRFRPWVILKEAENPLPPGA